MEVVIYLMSLCTGLTLIQGHVVKESLLFSCKMSEEIVSPPAKFKSLVWKYFGFPLVKGGEKVMTQVTLTVCRLCSQEIKYIKVKINQF